MKLVFVHGRSQQGKDPIALKAQWLDALNGGLSRADLPPVDPSVSVTLPFFGDELARLTALPSGDAIGRGGEIEDPVALFANELALDIVASAGVANADIRLERVAVGGAAIERGPENWEWVHAALEALARKVPGLSSLIVRQFTADVAAYLLRPSVREAVDAIVRPTVVDGCIVVGHSLGSVVAFQAIAAAIQGGARLPLFMTVGSPLGLPAIRRQLVPFPPLDGLGKWVNAVDRRDVVALVERLERPDVPYDIENISDIRNPDDNVHGIVGYLSDERVCRRMSAALLGEA